MFSTFHVMRSCFQPFSFYPCYCILAESDQSEHPAKSRGSNSRGKIEERLLTEVWALAVNLSEEFLLLFPFLLLLAAFSVSDRSLFTVPQLQ